jgi:FdhE protein
MTTRADSKSYLDLCMEMQQARSGFVTEHPESVEIPDAEIQKRRRENQHVLDLEGVKFEAIRLNPLSLRLLSVLQRHGVYDAEEVRRFSESQEKLNSGKLARIVLHREWGSLESLSLQYQVSADLLWFVGLNLVQAVLQSFAQTLKPKVDVENWNKGICPVCGNHPAMEKLRREDGKKVLWCNFCGTEWHYQRVKCPFCGADDHNSLRYFFVEEDATSDKRAYRVDVCDECKSYIKTLDERKLPEPDGPSGSERPDLYLQNLSTLFLDVLAQKDGYSSPTYWMMGPGEDACDRQTT